MHPAPGGQLSWWAVAGGRRQALGRGALLLGANTDFPKSGLGLGQHYKPVSVDDSLPNAPPAIPGECAVQDSWQYLSSAPVAYQMQQVQRAKEESYEDRGEEEQSLLGCMSQEDAHLPLIKRICKPFIDFTQQTRQKLQGSGTGITYPQKAEEKEQQSGTDTKDDDCVHPLWEPCILDKDHFQVPDLASNADFPELVPSKAAVKKKM